MLRTNSFFKKVMTLCEYNLVSNLWLLLSLPWSLPVQSQLWHAAQWDCPSCWVHVFSVVAPPCTCISWNPLEGWACDICKLITRRWSPLMLHCICQNPSGSTTWVCFLPGCSCLYRSQCLWIRPLLPREYHCLPVTGLSYCHPVTLPSGQPVWPDIMGPLGATLVWEWPATLEFGPWSCPAAPGNSADCLPPLETPGAEDTGGSQPCTIHRSLCHSGHTPLDGSKGGKTGRETQAGTLLVWPAGHGREHAAVCRKHC